MAPMKWHRRKGFIAVALSIIVGTFWMSGVGVARSEESNDEQSDQIGQHIELLVGLRGIRLLEDRLRERKTGILSIDHVMERFPVQRLKKVRQRSGGDVLLLNVDSKADAEKIRQALSRLSEVRYVEKNFIRKAVAIPNDANFGSQRNLHQNSDKDLDAPEAWDMENGDPNVVVAVVDSGVDLDHPDLSNNIWRNPNETTGNGVDDDHNGFVDDLYGWDFVDYYNNGGEDNDPNPEPDGQDNNNDNACPASPGNDCIDEGVIHGTHVAGIIGAKGNNGIGIAGIVWNTQLMAVRVLSDEGDGFDSDIVAGMDYAVANGADIINLSLGSEEFSQTMADAVADAFNAGVLVVAAAGNTGVNLDTTPFYPICNDGTENRVLGVAAIDASDQQTSFTNFGSTCVDVSGPGSSIESTLYTNNPGFGFTNDYGLQSGTSMATPHVSGVAALLKSFNPNLSVESIRDTIITSTDGIGLGVSMGSGRVNAHASLQNVDTSVPSGEILIASNAVGTNKKKVELSLVATTQAPDTISQMSFSNDGVTFSNFEAYSSKRSDWDLTNATVGGNSNEGTKIAYVRFKDSGGSISEVVSDSIIYDVTRPTKVKTLQAFSDQNETKEFVNGGRTNESTPYFSWSGASDSGSGVQGYYVLFGIDKAEDPMMEGSFQLKSTFLPKKIKKSQETNYYLKILTMDHAGNTSSNSSTFQYIFDTVVKTPSKLSLENQDRGILLQWVAPIAEHIHMYRVERAQGNSQMFKLLSSQVRSSSFLDQGAAPETVVRYRVRATDDLKNQSSYSKVQEGKFIREESIVVGAGVGGGPQVKIFSANGTLKSQFMAFEESFRGGVSVAVGDLDGDGTNEVIAGRNSGGTPEVRIFDFFGKEKFVKRFLAYAESFRGGLTVAAGDLNGDGKDEMITGTGPTGGPQVRVFDRNGKGILTNGFFAYAETFRGGVLVAAGDLNGDGKDEIIAGTGVGGGPQVRVFNGQGRPTITSGFFAYDDAFRGGVQVATGDLDGDGKDEILTGVGKGASPEVRVFSSGGQPKLTTGFMAFAKSFTGGIHLTGAETLQTGDERIVVAVASGGSPLIRVMNPTGSVIHREFFAFDSSFQGGIHLSSGIF